METEHPPAPPERPPARTLREHVSRTLELAWPVVLSRLAFITLLTIDVIVLGRAGADELAAYILGLSLSDSLMAATGGLMVGVAVLVARETGAGRDAAAGTIWRRGLLLGAGAGFAMAVPLQWAEPIYGALGQTAALAAAAGSVTALVAWALPFWAMAYCSMMFLEALHRPLVGTLVLALANALNLVVNIVLVFGAGPIPALGAQGAALSTVIVSAFAAVVLHLYIRLALPGRERLGLSGRQDAPRAGEQARIGSFAALSYLFEAGAFVAMTILVGWLGTLALASFGVLFQILGLVFMVAFGIAAATQVRVGNAWGRGDAEGMAMAGWTGLMLAGGFCVAMSAIALMLPGPVIGLFTTDEAVIAAAVPVVLWVGLALVFDGSQTVMSHACRGRGDTWVPTLLHFGSYWCVMVPAAYLLAIRGEGGVTGIYQAILIASVVSLSVLILRFRALARRV